MLGFVVPPEGSTLKKGVSIRVNARTKREGRGGLKKNQSERERRRRMKGALDAIGKFLGIGNSTKQERLTKIVNEGECFWHLDCVDDT